MWVYSRIISIIDLGNNYYLAGFTHGPWFIYGHYLNVKDLSPNFHPECDTIKEVAVWICVIGLPMDYYDARIMSTIRNTIGRIMKVDKNALQVERRKYARICVEVDLTNPFLAMFSIKGRMYKIEYERLHLLCLSCGRFGHYREWYPEIRIGKGGDNTEERIRGNDMDNVQISAHNVIVGSSFWPWRVVQKQKKESKMMNDLSD